MVDDMLTAYAAAQLMVGNLSQEIEAEVEAEFMKIGKLLFTIAAAAIGFTTLLLVLEEVVGRGRGGWRGELQ
ncbi:hypothetical protein B0H67DRAFT_645303 [Lasiosphaeris hirsuta]|uniref:Uncharacterized protein n=1 Tax=Lasiosphaeris hirsuta TaxID=260670 RepID=A0AA40AGS1_9PEZI|nr:hypothetical protein B0H67DRAFT_645303 [Lasiosphaeris hirsuta]